jgi:hypothetical protein
MHFLARILRPQSEIRIRCLGSSDLARQRRVDFSLSHRDLWILQQCNGQQLTTIPLLQRPGLD